VPVVVCRPSWIRAARAGGRPRPEHAVRRIVLGVLLVTLVIPGW
jgi:hypothetical protein